MSDRLFTPRFFVMCAYTFTVFVSLFQLLPAAPYHVLALGGTTFAAGLFLGFLTYASALSAPITGQIADRLGHRRVLIVVSLVLAVFSMSYAFITNYRVLLGFVFVHGLFWSGLLAASGAYMTATLPETRRAEGLGYWGLSSVTALAIAPPFGFWVFSFGWATMCFEVAALNLIMAAIAWHLPDDRDEAATLPPRPRTLQDLVEWSVLALSVSMALIAFGYGSLTSFSAMFADELGVSPRSLFLTVMASAILVGRISVGRFLDKIGHRRALLPCLAATALGMTMLALANGIVMFLLAALVFGAGFGLVYPAYTAYIMKRIPQWRRGAAFGAMLAAFDTGVGSGSTVMGGLIHQLGFRPAFGIAAALAVLSLPYFVFAEKRIGFK
ncbi:MAG TPA: MFS transporter [Vicinamibacterales bacterium]|nr:MFS transporter [Vicinamibacterales bacterium]